jgi:predicted RNA-binding Zn-ribbon protein involved in translation (DUF1610 family)
MVDACAKCGSHIESQWKFCPLCGVERAPEAHESAHMHHAHERAPVKGAFSGLLFGVIAAPVLIISGGMICLTGLGIVLGIPLIIAGVLAPLIGPMMGINSLKAACPWCGAEVSGVGIFDKFSCPTCGEHIVMKKHELLKADS